RRLGPALPVAAGRGRRLDGPLGRRARRRRRSGAERWAGRTRRRSQAGQHALGLLAGLVERLARLLLALPEGELADHPGHGGLAADLLSTALDQLGYQLANRERQAHGDVDEQVEGLVDRGLVFAHVPILTRLRRGHTQSRQS